MSWTAARIAPQRVAAAGVVLAVAASAIPAAEAKLRVTLALEPARPIAQQPVRVTLRTEPLPRRERLRLIAVGPWRQEAGQGVLFVPLGRIAPGAFTTSVRFAYAGRWRLQVVNAAGASFVFRQVRIRPRA